MICSRCGKESEEGQRFCPYCGNTLATAGQPATGAPEATSNGKRFLKTPGGIILVVFLALIVAAGITVGLILLLKGDGENSGERLARAWDEYLAISDDADEEQKGFELTEKRLGELMDRLKKTRERSKALKEEIDGIEVSGEKWTGKKERLYTSVKGYSSYVNELNTVYTLLNNGVAAGNLPDKLASVERKLIKLDEYAEEIRDAAESFLENNEEVGLNDEFRPSLFTIPWEINEGIKRYLVEASERDVPEVKDWDIDGAELVLHEILAAYRKGGWAEITGFMDTRLLKAYNSSAVPWDQVSYTVTGTDVYDFHANYECTEHPEGCITFYVTELLDDMGEPASADTAWRLVYVGGAWKLYDHIDGEYSKLDG